MTPPPTAPVATTRTSELWLEGSILIARFGQGVDVSLADAKENLDVIARLSRGRRLAVLVDLRPLKSQSAEARAYFAGPAASGMARAVALLIGSPLSQVLGNFYLRINRPALPTRLFASEEEALRWLGEVVSADAPGSSDAGA